MLGPAVKDALSLVQAAAGEQQFCHTLTVARPLLDLVEVAVVGDQGARRFLRRTSRPSFRHKRRRDEETSFRPREKPGKVTRPLTPKLWFVVGKFRQ